MRLFVEQCEHSKRLAQEHILSAKSAFQCHGETHQNWLVVRKSDLARVNALPLVLLQLPLEDVVIEEMLKLFVGTVDANLLEPMPTISAVSNSSACPTHCT